MFVFPQVESDLQFTRYGMHAVGWSTLLHHSRSYYITLLIKYVSLFFSLLYNTVHLDIIKGLLFHQRMHYIFV